MIIEIKKETTETVELKIPAYFKDKDGFRFSAILEDGTLIHVNETQLTMWNTDSGFYNSGVQQLITAAIAATEDEFLNEYRKISGSFERLINPVAV